MRRTMRTERLHSFACWRVTTPETGRRKVILEVEPQDSRGVPTTVDLTGREALELGRWLQEEGGSLRVRQAEKRVKAMAKEGRLDEAAKEQGCG